MKLLRRTIRRVLLEQDEYLQKLNAMYASNDVETLIQADELVDAIYGDDHPPGLRRYGVFDSYLGDTEAELLTKEEATTWHHSNPDWVPADLDGHPSDEPGYDESTKQYAYAHKAHLHMKRYPFD